MKIAFDLNWGSHLPVLMKIINMTNGPVLELGSGLYSSPLLYWACKDQGRKFVSYEKDLDWWKMVWNIAKDDPETTKKLDSFIEACHVEDWDKANIERPWDVVLVDHAPSKRRIQDIKRIANCANYIIIHDTQRNYKFCDYRQVWPLFKYRFDYTKAIPWTTVVSNFKDLSFLTK